MRTVSRRLMLHKLDHPEHVFCEYFTRYGDCGNHGECLEPAALQLVNNATRPMIRVCRRHADRIVERFPELGSVETRFMLL